VRSIDANPTLQQDHNPDPHTLTRLDIPHTDLPPTSGYVRLRPLSGVFGSHPDDVRKSRRKGLLRIHGKGDKIREVPLHTKLHDDLDLWLAERPDWPGADTNPALFLNRRGARLSVRGASAIIADIGRTAGLDEQTTAHSLRHSFATTLKMSRIASDASFGKIRERLLPATSPSRLDQGRLVEASSHAS
jgi:Phage integrase family